MNSKVAQVALCLVLMLGSWQSAAQNLKFKNYLVEDGISNNSVNQLANDSSGSIWIATWNGLNYFDGRSFLAYHHDPSDPTSLPGNYIYGVTVDGAQRVWVWADPNTLSLFQADSTFAHFPFKSKITKVSPSNGNDFLVEVDGSVYKFDAVERQFVPCSSCQNEEDFGDFSIPTELASLALWDILKDKFGNTWFGSKSHGLFLQAYDARMGIDALEQYESDFFNSYGLKSSEVTDLLEDQFGNVWLGLKDGGIARAIQGSRNIEHLVSHPVRHPELPNEAVRAVAEQADGTLWLGYYNSGVFIRKPGARHFEKIQVDPSDWTEDWDRIRSIFVDKAGNVWVGTYGGLMVASQHQVIKLFKGDGAASPLKRVYGFAEDLEGKKLWLGSWNGVGLYDAERGVFENYAGAHSLQGLHIRSLIFDDKTLYISTEKRGLAVFKDGKVSFFDKSKGLLDNSVYSVLKDPNSNTMWIGTHSGITIRNMTTGQLSYLTEENGLRSNFVYSMLSNGNYVWVSTAKGIAKINKETFEVLSFDPAEGWQSSEFSEGASFKTPSGYLYFGGVNGVNKFHPNDLESSLHLPKIYVDRELDWNGAYNSIAFRVTTIGFGLSAANKILYRVLPDDSWRPLDESGRLRLTDLKVGDHKLELKNSLDPDPEPVEFEFAVEMPWYRNPLWYFLIGLLLMAVVVWWRFRSSQLHRQTLERKIKERTRMISDQKTQLEIANSILEKRKEEIESQKDKLLILHSQLQNSNLEMEKFAEHLVGKIRLPFSDLKLSVETSSFRDSSQKMAIQRQLDRLMMVFEELIVPSQLAEFGEVKPSLTLLPELFDNLHSEIFSSIKGSNIQFGYSEDLTRDWVLLDVMRLKFFIQILFKEILKFLEDSAALEVQVQSDSSQLHLIIAVHSHTLLDGLEALMKYSLFFSSSQRVLQELSGSMKIHSSSIPVIFNVDIPIRKGDIAPEEHSIKNWKHLEMIEKIPTDKHLILFYGKTFEADGLLKMVEDDSFFIVQEQDPAMVASGLSTLKVDLLIIHNEIVSEDVARIVTLLSIKSPVPILFVYETISDSSMVKLMDLGINDFVQLPTSKTLLVKIIKNLLLGNKQKRHPEHMVQPSFLDDSKIKLSPNEKLIKEAVMMIREHYEKPSFKVETLYESLGISKIKLYRIFKDIVHQTPSDFILQMRMEKAVELLQKSKMNISEVSYECGFNDPKHFSKVFKKQFGMGPKRYQQVKGFSPSLS